MVEVILATAFAVVPTIPGGAFSPGIVATEKQSLALVAPSPIILKSCPVARVALFVVASEDVVAASAGDMSSPLRTNASRVVASEPQTLTFAAPAPVVLASLTPVQPEDIVPARYVLMRLMRRSSRANASRVVAREPQPLTFSAPAPIILVAVDRRSRHFRISNLFTLLLSHFPAHATFLSFLHIFLARIC